MSDIHSIVSKTCPLCGKPIEEDDDIKLFLTTKAIELSKSDIEEHEVEDPTKVVGALWDYTNEEAFHATCWRSVLKKANYEA